MEKLIAQQDSREQFRPAAVICEYNPFHNGHKYQLERTRELYGATHIAAIMSGSFVQRGDCAVYRKQVRARAALLGGADLVIELPLPWSMAAAESFAFGGVSLAEATGCDMLSFGSECGDIEKIVSAARLLEKDEVYEITRELQKTGMSFAYAREQAVKQLGGGEAASLLTEPNDILAVEYVRALLRTGSGIEPVCVRRVGAAHDEISGGGAEKPGTQVYYSASQLRGEIRNGNRLSDALPAGVPADVLEVYRNAPVTDLKYIDRLILSRLRLMDRSQLAALPGISEGLENRIYEAAGRAASFESLCAGIKCRRFTLSRVRRVLLSAVLGIPAGLEHTAPPYVRLLGMNSRGLELVRRGFGLPVVSGWGDAAGLTGAALEVFELNRRACELFAMCSETPIERGCDFAGGLIKL